MHDKLPFIIPERDLYFRLARVLVVLNELSYSRNGNSILNVEKILIFEFLIKYPHILKQVIKIKSSKINENFSLQQEEIGTIETLFPSKTSLYDLSDTQSMLKLLVAIELAEVEIKKGEIYYSISLKGTDLLNEIKTSVTTRITELCRYMLVLRSVKTKELKQIIEPFIKGA